MSEKDNFGSGFLLGTIIGGVVGGVIGAIATKKASEMGDNAKSNSEKNIYVNSQENIENSRLSLEEKINQLNHAIDDVRVTLTRNSEVELDS